MEFKPKFIERYSKLTNFKEFKKYSLSFLRRSIRVNTLKIEINDLKKRLEKEWNLKQIPWCRDGFWIEHKKKERRDIGNLIEHSLGYFYIQEAASLIPPLVLEPKPNEVVLDMCASPGSKSTQIAALMQNNGILIANDYTIVRMKPLTINLQRCGVANALITLMEGRFFKNSNIKFDKILVDAPCSGTGTIRKSLKTLKIWNPDMVRRLAGTQRQLIDTAFNILKENGTLVYSTCSLEPEEDEAVIDFLLNKYDNAKIEKIELKCQKSKISEHAQEPHVRDRRFLTGLKRSPVILEFEDKVYSKKIKDCLRIWPQDNDTEGFFVCKIRKISRNE